MHECVTAYNKGTMFRFHNLRTPFRCGARHISCTIPRRINPLLPFDVLEELENEETDGENRKLKDEKKLLQKERDKLKARVKSDRPYTEIDDVHANVYLNDKNRNDEEKEKKRSRFKDILDRVLRFLFKCLETIGITLSSVGILGLTGFMYHKFYNRHVLEKIDQAFERGDPAYQLAMHKRTNKRSEDSGMVEDPDSTDLSPFWVVRPQQDLVDKIVSGQLKGRYFLIVGERGTGKTTLIMEAMKKIQGRNVAIFDAHADPEIFRIRLGKAMDFAYSEDYIGSLFSIRGPRDTTALLDIERAFGRLEQLAVERRLKGKANPLVLIINNAHLIKENEEGVKLLELLQQKAEALGGSELVTMVFNSDDYWVYEKLKRLGTRLELIHVHDFNRQEAVKLLRFLRQRALSTDASPEVCNQVYDLVGGRPQHLNMVARHQDMVKACHQLIDREKTWFLNQCGLLGEEMDDDVMEFGKFSTSAMLLMREFVEMDRQRMTLLTKAQDAKGQKNHQLPELPLWRCRQIMTRPDYIQQYDNLNIFTVDLDLRVRADLVPMMRAFHEIALQPHFDELLEETIDRVGAIESLGRTRELVLKDLREGRNYTINEGQVTVSKSAEKEDDCKEELYMEELGGRKWWSRRRGFDQYLPREE